MAGIGPTLTCSRSFLGSISGVPIEVLPPFVKFQVTTIYCSFIALALKILLKVFSGTNVSTG